MLYQPYTSIHFYLPKSDEHQQHMLQSRNRQEKDFLSSANQLGCTFVPALSVSWSKSVISKQSASKLASPESGQEPCSGELAVLN